MAKWTSGWKWEPATQPSPSLWGAVDAGVGYPDVIVTGVNRCEVTRDLSWRLGRPWWMADPEGGTVSMTLLGQVSDIKSGDPIRIEALPAGILWTGFVDSVRFVHEPDGWTTQVNGSDALAILGGTTLGQAHGQAFAAGDLQNRVRAIASVAGVPNVTRLAPSVGLLPVLNAVAAPVTGSLVSLLTAYERSSNAIVAVDPDGTWAILPRAALPTTSNPPIVPLGGDDCPTEATFDVASVDRVINSWALGTAILKENATSITKYHKRTYEVVSQSATPLWAADGSGIYTDEMFTFFAVAPTVLTADVRITDRLSPVLKLRPFDFVSYESKTYQVMAMEWQSHPDEWTVTLSLDPTQNDIQSKPPITPEPPATTARVTETYLCDRDAYIVHTSGGSDAGNGASENLLIGRLADGNLCRALMRFNLGFNGHVVTVHSAKLVLYSSTYDCMTAGSHRAVVIGRITDAWSEGSYSTKCAFASSNSVKWPGPDVTTTGKATGTLPSSDSTRVEINVTDIVKAWASGSPNYGLRVRGSNEDSSTDRGEVWSRHYATTSRRPQLIVDYTYEVP